MNALAMLGGPRTVPPEMNGGPWPVVTEQDENAVLRVLRSGRLTAASADEAEVPALEDAWARQVGTENCTAVASGTAALQAALTALGIGPGDEVVLPALTMNATAHAVCRTGADPVFADIEPDTFTLSADRARDATTSRTGALLPVHLHGLPADMDGLSALARERGVPVVEDAAQSHGALHRGRATGALGEIGCFSLHPSKNLPACGEGGLITTDSADLHNALAEIRNFGERPPTGTRGYVALRSGSNFRMSPMMAAFARSQLERMPEYAESRQRSVTALLTRLAGLPGLRVPVVPEGRTHAWHIIRFRLVPEELDLPDVPTPALRAALHRVLRAEGVAVSRYQTAPLPAHPAFRAPGAGAERITEEFPVSCATVDGSLCLQRRHMGPDSGPTLSAYADAFEKVWSHMDLVRRMARSRPHEPGWQNAVEVR
ncbi:DegT/DnrJ/EryC1/StrS family aminotransferase [Nocardiopsis valliformis]|uniref:DegT/DnrJ/EryC1/StrS family aminotransferase n=1 Tax=Nocardiopsis valliformis TaxID=239974 RepID=UPI000344DF44|nr:DegT/DnrJ/EryC1/StrS family aminotransferase [Nocardiopsis valliformis]